MDLGGSIPFDVDPDKGKIDYRQVARHECGHAVVAIAKHKRIEYIRLGRSVVKETHAETKHEPTDDPRVECLIASAGVVAERRYSTTVLENAGKRDRENMEWWVARYPAAFPWHEDTEGWWDTFVDALEREADALLAQHSALFGTLVARLDELIIEWDWKPSPFGLWRSDVEAIIEQIAPARGSTPGVKVAGPDGPPAA